MLTPFSSICMIVWHASATAAKTRAHAAWPGHDGGQATAPEGLVDRPYFIVFMRWPGNDKLPRVIEPGHHGRRMKPSATINDENGFSAGMAPGTSIGGCVRTGLGQPAGNGKRERDRPDAAGHVAATVQGIAPGKPLDETAPPDSPGRQEGINRFEARRKGLSSIFLAQKLAGSQPVAS
jgi:hypothetical protein